MLIKALDYLGISPKEIIEEAIKNANVDSDENSFSPSLEFELLDGIEEIKTLLRMEKNEKESLTRRFDFFFNMCNFFYFRCCYYFINNGSDFFNIARDLIIFYCEEMEHFIKKKNISKKIKEGIDYLKDKKKDRDSCLALLFLYEIIIFSLDFMEKYEKAIKRKALKMESIFGSFSTEGKNTSGLFILNHLREIEHKIENLVKLFAEVHYEDLNKESIFYKINEMLYLELCIMANVFLRIRKDLNDPRKLDIPTNIDLLNFDSACLYIIGTNLNEDTNNECYTWSDNFNITYNELCKELEFIKGGPKCELSQLQIDAVNFIDTAWKSGITPIVALGMGTGKTRVACKKIIDVINENKQSSGYVLVITPANVILDWKSEMEKCNMAKPIEIRGNDRYVSVFRKDFDELNVYITSYDCVENDIKYYEHRPPLLIVYDELHQVNNSQKVQSKFYKLAELNLKAKYKLALTGTPAQNSVNDFYMNYCFFNEQKKYIPLIKRTEGSKIFLGSEKELYELKKKVVSIPMYFFGKSAMDKLDFKINYRLIPIAMYNEHFDGVKKLEKMNKSQTLIKKYS